MVAQKLRLVVEKIRLYVLQRSWSVVGEKPLSNGLQLFITDGITRVPIDCYNNGNALI